MNVVLLHGFGETADVWTTFLPLLPPTHSYIRLDYSRLTFCQSIEEYADWVHSEIEQRELTRFVLVGHSMGGYIALEYARKHAAYLAGLGLFHSTSYADSDEKKAVRDKTIHFIQKHGAAEFIADFLPNMYNDTFKRRNAVYIQQQLRDNQLIPAEALIEATKAMKTRSDNRVVLSSLNVPVAMVVGEKDKFISYGDSLDQLRLPKELYSLVLANSAHAGMLEAPKVCAALLEEFFVACE